MQEKNWFNELFKDVTVFQIALVLSLIIWFFYIGSATSLTPNLYNETDPVTNQTSYKVLYTPESDVPKSSVTGTHQTVGVLITLFLFFSFILRNRKLSGRMTEREAKELFINEWALKKGVPFNNGFLEAAKFDLEKLFSVVGKYETIGQERKMTRYAIALKLHDREHNIPRYFKVYIHPYDRMIDTIVECDRDLMDYDMCSRCGKEYTVSYVMGEDIQKFKSYLKDIKG